MLKSYLILLVRRIRHHPYKSMAYYICLSLALLLTISLTNNEHYPPFYIISCILFVSGIELNNPLRSKREMAIRKLLGARRINFLLVAVLQSTFTTLITVVLSTMVADILFRTSLWGIKDIIQIEKWIFSTVIVGLALLATSLISNYFYNTKKTLNNRV